MKFQAPPSIPSTINLDRLFRKHETVSGTLNPASLPGLGDYLASEKGGITYQVSGKVVLDQLSSQKRRIKCIILGWFEVLDPLTFVPERFDLNVTSNLIVVATENELPPLQDESDDEDYIVARSELDMVSLVDEEVLLALPMNAVRQDKANEKAKAGAKANVPATKSNVSKGAEIENSSAPISAFAKLAVLKKGS
jgi:uncharacterized protein